MCERTFADLRIQWDGWLLQLARKGVLTASSGGASIVLPERDENDACSLCEIAWVKAECNWERFTNKEVEPKVKAWLRLILTRTWIDILRKRSGVFLVSLDMPVDASEEGGLAWTEKLKDDKAVVPDSPEALAALSLNILLEDILARASAFGLAAQEVSLFLDYYSDTIQVAGHNYAAPAPFLLTTYDFTPKEKIQVLAVAYHISEAEVKSAIARPERVLRDALGSGEWRCDLDRACDAVIEQLAYADSGVVRRDLLVFSAFYSDANRDIELRVTEVAARYCIALGNVTQTNNRVRPPFREVFTPHYEEMYYRLYQRLAAHPNLTELVRRETLLLQCMGYDPQMMRVLGELLKADPTALKRWSPEQLYAEVRKRYIKNQQAAQKRLKQKASETETNEEN